MLECDWNAGSEAPDGPWHPAGGAWEGAVRTDRTAAMVGAELQSDDPAGLAVRWAEILDRPLSSGPVPEIALDNATLRFVETGDGRGDGLGGVDLEVADRQAILDAARSRGAAVDGDAVTVCGTRFRLT